MEFGVPRAGGESAPSQWGGAGGFGPDGPRPLPAQIPLQGPPSKPRGPRPGAPAACGPRPARLPAASPTHRALAAAPTGGLGAGRGRRAVCKLWAGTARPPSALSVARSLLPRRPPSRSRLPGRDVRSGRAGWEGPQAAARGPRRRPRPGGAPGPPAPLGPSGGRSRPLGSGIAGGPGRAAGLGTPSPRGPRHIPSALRSPLFTPLRARVRNQVLESDAQL